MIVGIGVDVVHVKRLEHWLGDRALLERFFHPGELETALSRGDTAHLSLAARFAAKEAFGKALGTGLAGIILKDIEVVSHHTGRPSIAVHGTAREALGRSGGDAVHLSLTHERDNAIAMVVIEKRGDRDGPDA